MDVIELVPCTGKILHSPKPYYLVYCYSKRSSSKRADNKGRGKGDAPSTTEAATAATMWNVSKLTGIVC